MVVNVGTFVRCVTLKTVKVFMRTHYYGSKTYYSCVMESAWLDQPERMGGCEGACVGHCVLVKNGGNMHVVCHGQ